LPKMQKSEWSLNAAAVELRVDRRRIAKLAEDLEAAGHDGHGHPTYWLRDLVDALFANDRLDPQQEKAKLDKERRKAQEMKNAVDERELIPASEVEARWSAILGAVRARLLNLPTGKAPEVAVESDPAACEKLLREGVYEALQELSEWKPSKD